MNGIEACVPSRNNFCLCGSGSKFKNCCVDSIKGCSESMHSVFRLLSDSDYSTALLTIRANITNYTIRHRQCVVRLKDVPESMATLFDLDIKALASLIDQLQICYTKLDMNDRYISCLELLLSNIDDERWSEKIAYYKALHFDHHVDDQMAAKKCLESLVDLKNCQDSETLQLYLSVSRKSFTLSETLEIIERILKVETDIGTRLHCHGKKAVEHIMVHEMVSAKNTLTSALGEVSQEVEGEDNLFLKTCIAKLRHILGKVSDDEEMMEKSLGTYRSLLDEGSWTKMGNAHIYFEYALALTDMNYWTEAKAAFEVSYAIDKTDIHLIWISQCCLQMNLVEEAFRLLDNVDVELLDEYDFVDYAWLFTGVAIAKGDRQLLERAKLVLKSSKPDTPYFTKQMDTMLILIYETIERGSGAPLSKKVLRALKLGMKNIMIKPNIFGFGFDFNGFIDDVCDDDNDG